MNAEVAAVAGAGGELGPVTAAALAACGLTVVAVDRNESRMRALPEGVRREVADASDPAAAAPLTRNAMVYSHHRAYHGGAFSLFEGVVRFGHEETRRLQRRRSEKSRPPRAGARARLRPPPPA